MDMPDMLEHDDPTTTLAADLAALPDPPEAPSDEEIAAALRPHLWLPERATDGGIPPTAAGYLEPADVEALAAGLPTMAGWVGKANRVDLTWPAAEFRDLMTKPPGLLRNDNSLLLLTRAGAAARDRPRVLFAHLASRLRQVDARGVADDADLLVLAYAAAGVGTRLPWAAIHAHLGEISYRVSDGSPVDAVSLRHAGTVCSLLEAIGERFEDHRPLTPQEHTAVDVALASAVHAADVPVLPMAVDRLLRPERADDADHRLADDGRLPGRALRRLVAGDLAGVFDGPPPCRSTRRCRCSPSTCPASRRTRQHCRC